MAFNLTQGGTPGDLSGSIQQVLEAAAMRKAQDEETPTAFGTVNGSPRFAGQRLGPPRAGLGGEFGVIARQGGPLVEWYERRNKGEFSPLADQSSSQGVA